MLYISPFTVIVVLFFFLFGNLKYFLICYLCMLLHETAHLVAALVIGLSPKRLCLMPYGVSLTLKNKIIYSLWDEMALYLAGPAANITLALFSAVVFGRGKLSDYFYACNLLLFFMNMLPVLPLDGGALTEKAVMRFFGVKAAKIIMRILGILFSALFLCLGIFIFLKTKSNISLFLILALIVTNAFSQDEKYQADTLREFIFYKNKQLKPIHSKTGIIVADQNCNNRLIAENLTAGKYSLVFLTENNKVKEIKTESQIIEDIIYGKEL